MSANGKRVLPTTAASTAALVPFSHPGYATGQPGRNGDSDELIDQLVGGLVQADRSAKSEANFFNQREDAGSYGRTYSIDDEEIDEPPVPIPSTWQAPTVTKEPSWLAEQLKASAYGFVIGLFVVIPAVMLLTGQTERLPSWAAVTQYASATATQFGVNLNLNQTESAGTVVASTEVPASTTTVAPTTASAPVVATPKTGEPRSTSSDTTPNNSADSAQINVATTAPSSTETTIKVTSVDTNARSVAGNQTASGLATTDRQIASLTPPVKPVQPSTLPSSQAPSLTPGSQAIGNEQASQDATDPAAPPPAAPAATQSEVPGASSATRESSAANEQANALAEARANVLANNNAATPSIAANTSGADAQTGSQSGDAMPDALTIETAQFLMKNGKMKDGRVILAKLASRGHSAAIFALAESFDPNVLASWGSSGMVAEPEKAKIFYSMALSQGVEDAIMRLKGLE